MNGVQRGGMYIKPPDWPAPPNWMPYAQVASVDASAANLESVGAKVLVEPMDVPGGSRICSLEDPAGAPFAIHSFPAGDMAAKPKAKAKAKAKAKPATKPKAKLAVRAKAAGKQLKKKAKAARKTVKKVLRKASRKVARVVKKAKAKAKTRKSKVARRKK
jgi:hypothetical protein